MKTFLYLVFIAAFATLTSCKKDEKRKENAERMQDFIIELSTYAKGFNSSFAIIPQNGIQLSYYQAEPENPLRQDYMDAIDGYGMEGLFYNGKYNPDTYRINMVTDLHQYKPMFLADYTKDNSKIQHMYDLCAEYQLRAFPRTKDNFHYTDIPSIVPGENANDVLNLADSKNYLYLINSDKYSTKEQFIAAIQATNFDVVFIDCFFNEEAFTSSEVNSLKTKANGGKRQVICYMNIGSAEKFRYYWQSGWRLHQPKWLKKKYPGYSDEVYVEYWNEVWKSIIFGNDSSYLKKIIDAQFYGVYLDNVEAYYYL